MLNTGVTFILPSNNIYLSSKESHAGPVDPGVVGSGGHCLQVVLSLGRIDASTRQLAIIDDDSVSLHGSLHLNQSICGNTHPSTAYITETFYCVFSSIS